MSMRIVCVVLALISAVGRRISSKSRAESLQDIDDQAASQHERMSSSNATLGTDGMSTNSTWIFRDLFNHASGEASDAVLNGYQKIMRSFEYLVSVNDTHLSSDIELQMACLASRIYSLHPSNVTHSQYCYGIDWPPKMLYSFTLHGDETERVQLYENSEDTEHGNYCAMVWVGTSNLKNVLTDINAFKQDFCGYEVHTGFANQYKRYTGYNQGTEWATMKAWWRTCKADGRKLVTTGHSLGGAMAAIFAACSLLEAHDIEEVDALYSLGMPAPTNPPLSKHGQVFPGVRFVHTARFLGSTYYDMVPVVARVPDRFAIQNTLGVMTDSVVGMHFPEQDAVMVGWEGIVPPLNFDAENYRFTRFGTGCVNATPSCCHQEGLHCDSPEPCVLSKDTSSHKGCEDPANSLPWALLKSNILLHPYFFYVWSIKAWCDNGKKFNGPDGTLSSEDAVLTGHSPDFLDHVNNNTVYAALFNPQSRRRDGGPVNPDLFLRTKTWESYSDQR